MALSKTLGILTSQPRDWLQDSELDLSSHLRSAPAIYRTRRMKLTGFRSTEAGVEGLVGNLTHAVLISKETWGDKDFTTRKEFKASCGSLPNLLCWWQRSRKQLLLSLFTTIWQLGIFRSLPCKLYPYCVDCWVSHICAIKLVAAIVSRWNSSAQGTLAPY